MRVLSVVAMLTAFPVSAQSVQFSPAQTSACVDAAGDAEQARACIGLSAAACVENTPGGDSTYGMSACYDAERAFWDALLNSAYQRQLETSKDFDAASDVPGPGMFEALKDMQRAWIPYRDAACAFEYAQWGGGTGGGPAEISCLMRKTAEQALLLEFTYLAD